MAAFRLLLRLHSPVVLPVVVPRLDTLLHEAACRLSQSWTADHALPLAFDDDLGGYRGSQILFGTTVNMPMMARHVTCPSSPESLDRHLVSNPRRLQESGGPYVRRLSRHQAYLSPYLVFYGDGDPDRCADMLQLLDGIGREHGRGGGGFTVADVTPDSDEGWRYRSAPADTPADLLPYAPIRSRERLVQGGPNVDVVHPPRVAREVIS